jgi:antitoxin component YwqK of YwqJK toxin-antitoxin module
MKNKLLKNLLTSKRLLFSILFLIVLFGCKSKMKAAKQIILVNQNMLDSIKKQSDSTWTKPYFARDFAEALYYKNSIDTTLTQIMKDKDAVIRQIIVTQNKTRIFFAQYYSNGQLMAKYNLDKYGQYDGHGEEYYETGFLKTTGNYSSGFHTGKWKNFDDAGNYVSTDEYNADGQVANTIKE